MELQLFRINEVSKLPELTPEARGLEPFRSMYRRVLKGYPGDADGRNKVLNEKEILFAYYSANHNSNLRYADDDERIKRLKVQLAMTDDWKPDQLVNDTIKAIIDSQWSINADLLDEAVETIKALRAYYKNIKTDIKNNPQTYSKKPKLITEIVDTFKELKKAIEEVETLRDKYSAEISSRRSRKGRAISKFETEDI